MARFHYYCSHCGTSLDGVLARDVGVCSECANVWGDY